MKSCLFLSFFFLNHCFLSFNLELLLLEMTIDPLKIIKYWNKIKIMIPLGFEPRDNLLPIPVLTSTPSPWPIQAPSLIKVKNR